jgi:hypothetical protein
MFLSNNETIFHGKTGAWLGVHEDSPRKMYAILHLKENHKELQFNILRAGVIFNRMSR